MARGPARGWRKFLLTLLGLAASVFFVQLSIRDLDWERTRSGLANADLTPWLGWAIACYLTGHVLRGVRTRVLVSRHAQLSTWDATNVVVLGYAVNNLLPARPGEFARAGMLTRLSGLSWAQSLTVTLLERLLDGIVMVLFLIVAVTALQQTEGSATSDLLSAEWARPAILLATALFSAGLIGLLALVVFPGLVIQLVSRAISWFIPRSYAAVVGMLTSISSGVAALRRPRQALDVVALTVLVWTMEAGLYCFLLPAFGLEANWWHGLLAMSLTNLGLLLPSSPGFIGAFHYFCMQSLVFLGVRDSVALGYATLVHLAFYFPITLWGVAILIRYGLDVLSTRRLEQRAQALPSDQGLAQRLEILGSPMVRSDPDPKASKFLHCLAEAVVPIRLLPEDQQVEVVASTARFVGGQIACLSFRQRCLVKLALTGFRVSCWLRTLRPFTSLERTQRERLVTRWAEGSFPQARQLMRLVRSTAFLAFFEHPACSAALPGNPESQR